MREPLLDQVAVELDEPWGRENSWLPIRGPAILVQFNKVVKYSRGLLYTC
jgi:hypothetical protein